MNALAAALAIVIGFTGHALAWGDEGHRIVAEIAEQYLEPQTMRQVRELLALENATTLAEVSTWADEIRGQRRETARWHYVNIPINPPVGGYNAERDCPRGDCVVAAIDRFAGMLRDKAAPARDRLEALKFVVHLVADVHQPLHASNNGDRGGNDVRVELLGRQTNLHAVWDWGILALSAAGSERAYALRLAREITSERAKEWQDGTSANWATESYRIARRLIYGEWRELGSYGLRSNALPGVYSVRALPLLNEQLEKAGVRLARVLNAALE